MKIFDIVLLEEAQKIYAIGDSHAVAIAQAGGFVKLAANGRSAFSDENLSAIEMVPPRSTVVLSAGANDMNNQNKGSVIQRIEKLLFELVNKKKCNVWFVLLAGTDAPAFVGEKDRLRNELAKQIPADFPEVKILDIGNLSIKTGDGIHAPTPWYQKAANEIKKSAPPVPVPAAQSGQEKPPAQVEKPSDAGASQDTPKPPDKLPTFTVPQGNGTELKKLQLALMALGYDVGAERDDGKMGPHTREGIKHFQRDHKLPETGVFDEATVSAITAAIQEAYKNGKKPIASSRGMGQSPMVTNPKSNNRVSANEVSDYLKSKGLDDNHRAGILANIEAESAFIVDEKTGDKGLSWGLFQWQGPRRDNMIKAVPDWETNWKGQIDFALQEDAGPRYLARKFGTAGEAASWWSIHWERPRDKQGEANKRARLAKKYL